MLDLIPKDLLAHRDEIRKGDGLSLHDIQSRFQSLTVTTWHHTTTSVATLMYHMIMKCCALGMFNR